MDIILEGGPHVNSDVATLQAQPCLIPDDVSGALTMPTAIRRFIDHCRVAKCLSSHTLRAYDCDLKDFVTHAGADARLTHVCDKSGGEDISTVGDTW